MTSPRFVVAAAFLELDSSASVDDCCSNIAISLVDQRSKRVIAFYEKVIKVKADVAAYLINCFPSA